MGRLREGIFNTRRIESKGSSKPLLFWVFGIMDGRAGLIS